MLVGSLTVCPVPNLFSPRHNERGCNRKVRERERENGREMEKEWVNENENERERERGKNWCQLRDEEIGIDLASSASQNLFI